MKIIDRLIAKGIPINWTTIKVGWQGVGKYVRRLIEVDDIILFAVEAHSNCSVEQSKTVLLLMGVTEKDKELIDSCLHKLHLLEGKDVSLEARKWRLGMVEELISDLENEALGGLLQLTEFWEQFNFPDDSPHVVQGLNNAITPKDYYTEINFKSIIEHHKKWISNEQKLLVNQ